MQNFDENLIGEKEEKLIEDALEKFKKNLLDLTLRNSLIKFNHKKGETLQFVSVNSIEIYNELILGNIVSIEGIKEPSKEEILKFLNLKFDTIENLKTDNLPEIIEYAKSQGISTSYDIQEYDFKKSKNYKKETDLSILTLRYENDLLRDCRKIFSKSESTLQETGSNTLFLIIGFLEYKDSKDSSIKNIAPMINIPIRLKNIKNKFFIEYTEEELLENLAIKEKLFNDFGLKLPDLNDDDDNLDIEVYIEKIKEAIAGFDFSFKNMVSIGVLNFKTLLMIKDLDKKKWPSIGSKNALTRHRIVRKILIGEQSSEDQDNKQNSTSKERSSIDYKDIEDSDDYLVYDADSSQHQAILDVVKYKKDLVIEGPPGTGKSQTITNIITSALSNGMKVLFVAEKLTALNVVMNRLKQKGFDLFALELHGEKSSQQDFVKEISRRIELTSENFSNTDLKVKKLQEYRSRLNSYVSLINKQPNNKLNISFHEAVWRSQKYNQEISDESKKFVKNKQIADACLLDEHKLYQIEEKLDSLLKEYKNLEYFGEGFVFSSFKPKKRIAGDEDDIEKIIDNAMEKSETLFNLVQKLDDFGLTKFSPTDIDKKIEDLKYIIENVNTNLPQKTIDDFFSEQNERNIKILSKFLMLFIDYKEVLKKRSLCLLNNVDPDTSNGLIQKLKRIQEFDFFIKDFAGIKETYFVLESKTKSLSMGYSRILKFFKSKNIPGEMTVLKLFELQNAVQNILNLKEEKTKYFKRDLFKQETIEEIRSLKKDLRKITDHKNYLESNNISIKTIKDIDSLKSILQIFRKEKRWYEFYKKDYRNAKKEYLSLQKEERTDPNEVIIKNLEKIIEKVHIKEKLKQSTFWKEFLNIDFFDSDYCTYNNVLDKHIEILEWHRNVLDSSETNSILLFDHNIHDRNYLNSLIKECLNIKPDIDQLISELDLGSFKYYIQFLQEDLIESIIQRTNDTKHILKQSFDIEELITNNNLDINEIIEGFDYCLKEHTLQSKIKDNEEAQKILGNVYLPIESTKHSLKDIIETNIKEIDKIILFSKQINASVFDKNIKENFSIDFFKESHKSLVEFKDCFPSIKRFKEEISKYCDFDFNEWIGISLDLDIKEFLIRFREKLEKTKKDYHTLDNLYKYNKCLNELKDIEDFIRGLLKVNPNDLKHAYLYCLYGTIVKDFIKHNESIAEFSGTDQNEIRDKFKELDKELINLRSAEIIDKLIKNSNPPAGDNSSIVSKLSEMALLNYLSANSKKIPIRKILKKSIRAVQELKPCFMMSPQSVARYLDPLTSEFDLLIIDEASQVQPATAIGAIARSKQIVIVGDPKQLPPTDFFKVQKNDFSEDSYVADAESILDACSSIFKDKRRLLWHYRSQHHSLISFSNHEFYDNKLIIFPSPHTKNDSIGIKSIYVKNAIYQDSKNYQEAKYVIDEIIKHMTLKPHESLAVITLNDKQRDLIQDIFDDKKTEEAKLYEENWSKEGSPFIIKNLENIQGDERDAIIISTTFGKDIETGHVYQRFGPIARENGGRRLNVLFTRAKRSITLCTSLLPGDIVVNEKTPKGTRIFKDYLHYANSGLLSSQKETNRAPDSPFEESVIKLLKSSGYEVTPQLGVASYRIDIAVKNPKNKFEYIAAIECDGATYHSALSARDRDRIRQDVIESLGWKGKIYRIWSTDWFRFEEKEKTKLLEFLDKKCA